MALFLQFRCHYSSKKRWQVKPSVHIPSGSLGLHILILCAHRQIVLAMTQLTEDDPYRYTEYLKSGSFSCLRRWPGSIAETEDDLIKRLNEWNDNMENRGMRATQTHTQPFYSSLDFVWVSRYQKNHSPSHTYRGHQLSHISFIHLIWSMASALFNLRAWQSFTTISLQVFFGLPLGVDPSTSYSIHFFTQSLSSFRSTWP